MTAEEWQQVWAVYNEVADLPAAERTRRIAAALPDSEMQAKLEELLADSEEEAAEAGSPAPPAAEGWRLAGQSLGRFELREAIGRGGMGEVYRAFDSELHRDVAIKCVAPSALGSSHAIADFQREARAASALNHPGIVTVYEILRTTETVAIVMELVEGESFRKLTSMPRPAVQVARWGRQVAEALAACHERGIIHRDIKPENLILRRDGYAKVLDFGLAAERSAAAAALPMGTVRYMSPEQSRSAALTPASDIFSLGVVLFELATGVHPFDSRGGSDTTLSIAQAIAGGQTAALPANVALPPDFERLLRRMMAPDAARRPSAREVSAELAELSAAKPTRTRRWILAGLSAAAAVALGAQWLLRPKPAALDAHRVRMEPFTTYEGRASQPSFSPDGSAIAFVWSGEDGNNQDIYVKRTGESSPRRLTTDPNEDLLPTFSPDGREIAFLRQSGASNTPFLMTMHADGSGARAIRQIAASFGFLGLAWWPDGKSLVVRDTENGAASLFRIQLDDGRREPITHAPVDENDGRPAFSPDGKWLAFLRYQASGTKVCVLRPRDPAERCLAQGAITDIAWARDSRHIWYNDAQGLWSVNVDGAAEPQELLPGSFTGLATDRSGHRFAFVRSYSDMNVWRVGRDGKDAKRLIASSGEDSAPDWSPDGKRIVLRSNRSGTFELYTYAADGSDGKQITHFGAHIDNPRWSPDGKWIAFDGNRSTIDPKVKHHNVYVVPAEGGPFRAITDDAVHYEQPAWSPDGQWLYYLKDATSEETWRVRPAGGAPQLVDPQPMQDLAFSPDGQFLYYVRNNGAAGIRRARLGSGSDETLPGTGGVQLFRYWSLARDGIFFIPGPPDTELRFLNLRTRKVSRIAAVPSKLYKGPRGLAASPDGRWILYTLEDVAASDIMLATIQ